jgi:hypothetical protein
VAKDGAAHFQQVTIGQDFGSEIEIVQGLSGDEQIIANPGERITEGAKVATGPTEPSHVAQAEAKPAEKPAPAKVVNAAVAR